MDTIIYSKNQYHCYLPIRSNCIVAYGKSNLTSNDIENIRLSHSLFQSLLHFKGYHIANTLAIYVLWYRGTWYVVRTCNNVGRGTYFYIIVSIPTYVAIAIMLFLITYVLYFFISG